MRAVVLLIAHAAAGCVPNIDMGGDDGEDAGSGSSSSAPGTSSSSSSESSSGQGDTSSGLQVGTSSGAGPVCIYAAGPYEPCSDECSDCSGGTCAYPAVGIGLAHCSYECRTADDCPEPQVANSSICHDGMCWIGCTDGACPDGQECFDLMIDGVPPRCFPPELQPA